jgi:hypothetical protein
MITIEQLKIWRANVRRRYKKGQLSQRDIQLIESIPDWEWEGNAYAIKNKKQLIEMAKRGEPRPKHPLARKLSVYICKSATAYDSEFDKEIRKLRPDWFVGIIVENKNKLIEMAKRGEPKPRRKDPLGRSFKHYTSVGSHARKKLSKYYDSEFDKELRKLRPDWFVDATEYKKQLIEMAKRGEPKPKRGCHALWCVLSNYIHKTSKSYDPKFNKKIRKLRPDWFVNTAVENRKQLIEMAKRGEPRPAQRSPLGGPLCEYTNKKKKGSYNSEFDKEIRKLRPDWFVNIATENKKKLIAMAKRGEPRPIKRKHPLGACLSNYLSYDSGFNKEIRKLRPDWFKA